MRDALVGVWVRSDVVCYRTDAIHETGWLNESNVQPNSSTSINGRLVSPDRPCGRVSPFRPRG